MLASTPFLKQPIGELPFQVQHLIFAVCVPVVLGALLALPGSRVRQPEAVLDVYGVDGADERTSKQRKKRPSADESARDRHAWRIVLGLGLPIVIAFLALHGDWSTLQWGFVPGLPSEKWHSLMWAALVSTAFGLVMSFTPRTWWVRAILFAVLAAAVTACIWPVFQETDSMQVRLIAPAAVFLLACAFEPLLVRRGGASVIFPIGIAIAALSIILLASVSMSMPMPLIAMGLALFGMFVVTLLPGRFVRLGDGPVCVLVTAMVLFPFVVQFYLYQEPKPYLAFALPTVAVLAMWLAEPRLEKITRVLFVVLVCAIAGWLTYRWMNPETTSSSGTSDEDAYWEQMYQ